MAIAPFCLMLSATLSITPHRSQFFSYETISLKCEANSTGWTVNRRTKTPTPEKCAHGWALPAESSCLIEDSYRSDTGVYWCQYTTGACSNTINITVTDGVVILESPAYPVMEGDIVTLGCSYRKDEQSPIKSDFLAAFYKDGAFIGKESSGKLTIERVSKKDEGFYKCQHPSEGASPQSLLTVSVRHKNPTAPTTPPPAPPTIPPITLTRLIGFILLFVIYTVILILAVYLYRRCARTRADAKKRACVHLVLE
ncbi:Fc receptor-like protein 5 [Mugil cephalus]|uniref:Fc receptor-like protein 5 n=1 Tax=Mugil cephalus TaxID=48193 RepID=UPI001FB8379C|nr:Fc receptor-like protein 5 [Mugil cephalus]